MVTLAPDGRAWEVSSEQADNEQSSRVYSGMALDTPEHWEQNHYILTMTMLDRFEAKGRARTCPTTQYTERHIYIYISNETANEIVDFTMHDFTHVQTHI